MYQGSIAISYENPAVHLQQSSSISGLYRVLNDAKDMAQVDSEVLNVLDVKTALKKVGEYYGVSASLFK
jgi:hypothetical protein